MAERRSPRTRQWPLRRRLMLAVVALLLVITTVIVALSIVVQRQLLINRVDEQLQVALDMPPGEGPAPGQPDEALQEGPAPRLGSFELTAQDGSAVEEGQAILVDEEGTSHSLPGETSAELLEAAEESAGPFTVGLEEFGAYRVDSRERQGEITMQGHSLAEADRTVRDMTLTFGLIALGGIVVAAVIARSLTAAGLKPLERLAETASRVSATPLSTGEVSLSSRVSAEDAGPTTETGQLGAAFNQMLDHVEISLQARQQSEERLRRFIADAGHELRTPLASIDGHIQLASRSEELPQDVRRSISRISSESSRMTSLVEDLLLLARLDAGAPLRKEKVQIAGLLVDTVTDAQAAFPEHRWEVELPEDAAELVVTGDEGRLHQLLANLLSNAGRHTPAGTRVVARLADVPEGMMPEGVVLEVQDEGPGIPEELLPRIFDRFVRGDGSRSNAPSSPGSTGLGMSIAAAVAEAHEGSLEVESRPGRTIFRCTLPRG